MKSVLIRMKQYRLCASSAEQCALDYLLANPETVSQCNIHQFAERSYSSASTIVRLCRKLGFDGYRDLQKSLLYELAVRDKNLQEKKRSIGHTESLSEIITDVTHQNIASLHDSIKLLDLDTVQKSVDIICSCDTLLLFGLGASYLVAHDADRKSVV